MKKMIALVLVIACVLGLAGCGVNYLKYFDADVCKAYCYVSCVTADGFVASINDIGHVFIEYADAEEYVGMFDTVVVEYYDTALIEKRGSCVDSAGMTCSYIYIIENPRSVRASDPSKGEPVFG